MMRRLALCAILASPLALLACDDPAGAPVTDDSTSAEADTRVVAEDAGVDSTVAVDTAADTSEAGPSAYTLTVRGAGYAGASSREPVLDVAIAVWDDDAGERVHWERLAFPYADDSFEVVLPDLLAPGHRYRVATHGLTYPDNSVDEVAAVDGDVTVDVDWRSSEGEPEGFFLTSTPVAVPPGRYDWNPSHAGRLIIGVTDAGFLYRLATSFGCQLPGGGCGSFLTDTQVRCNESRRIFKWPDADTLEMDASYEEKYQEATLTVDGDDLVFTGVMGSDCCEHAFDEALVRTGDLGVDCP